jgi:hypothetical protein
MRKAAGPWPLGWGAQVPGPFPAIPRSRSRRCQEPPGAWRRRQRSPPVPGLRRGGLRRLVRLVSWVCFPPIPLLISRIPNHQAGSSLWLTLASAYNEGGARLRAPGSRRPPPPEHEIDETNPNPDPRPGTAPPLTLRCRPPNRFDKTNPNPDPRPGATPPLALRCHPPDEIDETNPIPNPRPCAAPPLAIRCRPPHEFDETNPIPNPRPDATPPLALRRRPPHEIDKTNPNPPPAPPSGTPPKALMLYWEFPHAT